MTDLPKRTKICQWCGEETTELFIVFDREILEEVGICGDCQIEIDKQMEIAIQAHEKKM